MPPSPVPFAPGASTADSIPEFKAAAALLFSDTGAGPLPGARCKCPLALPCK